MSMSDHPLVTILTPVYNGDAYLAECIESVLSQKYRILSTSSSLIAARIGHSRLQPSMSRKIRAFGCTERQTRRVIENHNIAFGLMSPKAKYCKVVSGDDTISTDCIARMVEVGETLLRR